MKSLAQLCLDKLTLKQILDLQLYNNSIISLELQDYALTFHRLHREGRLNRALSWDLFMAAMSNNLKRILNADTNYSRIPRVRDVIHEIANLQSGVVHMEVRWSGRNFYWELKKGKYYVYYDYFIPTNESRSNNFQSIHCFNALDDFLELIYQHGHPIVSEIIPFSLIKAEPREILSTFLPSINRQVEELWQDLISTDTYIQAYRPISILDDFMFYTQSICLYVVGGRMAAITSYNNLTLSYWFNQEDGYLILAALHYTTHNQWKRRSIL